MAKRKKRITADDTLGILGDPPVSDDNSPDESEVSSPPSTTKEQSNPTVDEKPKGKASKAQPPGNDVSPKPQASSVAGDDTHGSENTDSALEESNVAKSSSSAKKKRKSKASKKKPKPMQDEHSDIPTLYIRKRDGVAVGSMQITLPKKLIKMIKAEAVLSSDPNHSVFVARQILGDKYDEFMDSIG